MPERTGVSGRTALVTGAAHGIGRSIVGALASRGARVWACDVLQSDLDETVRLARAAGGSVEGRAVNIASEEAVGALVTEITHTHGGVEILVHAAGGVARQIGRPIEQITMEEWRAVFRPNLEGAFLLARAVVPGMKARGWGRIVTISSGAGRSYSQTGIQAYASAKAGLIGFTRQIARELGVYGVTANSIAPGFVLSNPESIKQWEALGDAGQQSFFNALAIKRLGDPEDIAFAVLFFASEEASYVTGQTISVDGGRWMLG